MSSDMILALVETVLIGVIAQCLYVLNKVVPDFWNLLTILVVMILLIALIIPCLV